MDLLQAEPPLCCEGDVEFQSSTEPTSLPEGEVGERIPAAYTHSVHVTQETHITHSAIVLDIMRGSTRLSEEWFW